MNITQSLNFSLFSTGLKPTNFLHDIHIKLFPQCDEHLFFSVPGIRNHLPHVMRMLSVMNFQNGGQVKEGN